LLILEPHCRASKERKKRDAIGTARSLTTKRKMKGEWGIVSTSELDAGKREGILNT